MKNEYYYPDLPWAIIKSYNLTFDKTRVTKSAKLMKEYCNNYEQMVENDEILPDTSFSFVYFYSMMTYKSYFNYNIFPTYLHPMQIVNFIPNIPINDQNHLFNIW
jgi:hypothetical protein